MQFSREGKLESAMVPQCAKDKKQLDRSAEGHGDEERENNDVQ